MRRLKRQTVPAIMTKAGELQYGKLPQLQA